MGTQIQEQGTITKWAQDTYLLTWIGAFLTDRKAQNMSPGTLHFYRSKLELFTRFCEGQAVTQITQIDSNLIRQFMLWLEETGHNPGGIHACYRTLKTFLRWWEDETEPDNWKNPINKVKAPRVGVEPLTPVSLSTVKALVDICPLDTLIGARDRAIFYTLLDTGARASELCAMDIGDFDDVTGGILIRQGKGRKPRTVYLGKKSRKAVRQYLRMRQDDSLALWVTDLKGRLTYWGLKDIIRRRSNEAGVEKPKVHDFRRAFALNMLRAGVDVYSLQLLMGHEDLQILRRYLKQNEQDTEQAHRMGSPVDRM
ncbi:MAG: tyrosine-type recombinase/integrase [Anaerolineaceae bacterium]